MGTFFMAIESRQKANSFKSIYQTLTFPGLATNVSVQLLVASMGSINTENMVKILFVKVYLGL